jgi:site-specific DNA recombinase
LTEATESGCSIVQGVLNERAQRGQRDVVHHHWAKGLLWCARYQRNDRSSRLVFSEAKGNGWVYQYYICTSSQQGVCDLRSLPVGEVEQELEREFGSLQISHDLVDTIRREVELAREQTQSMDRELRTNIRAKLRQIDINEERLLDLAADAAISTVKLRERLNALQLERGDLEQKLAITDSHLERGAQVLNSYLELLNQPSQIYARADDEVRRQLTQTFFSKLLLDFDSPVQSEARDLVAEIREVAGQLKTIAPVEDAPETKKRRTKSSANLSDSGLLARFFFYHGLSKQTLAGVPGLEPRTKESESSVLPITPYPTASEPKP